MLFNFFNKKKKNLKNLFSKNIHFLSILIISLIKV